MKEEVEKPTMIVVKVLRVHIGPINPYRVGTAFSLFLKCKMNMNTEVSRNIMR